MEIIKARPNSYSNALWRILGQQKIRYEGKMKCMHNILNFGYYADISSWNLFNVQYTADYCILRELRDNIMNNDSCPIPFNSL